MDLPDFLAQDADGFIHLRGHRIGLQHIVHCYDEGYSAEMLAEEFPALSSLALPPLLATASEGPRRSDDAPGWSEFPELVRSEFLEPAPVIGKGEMGGVRKLFALTGKQCAVLADLDAFVDDGKLVGDFYGVSAIEEDLTAKGHRSLQVFSAAVRDDLKKTLLAHYSDLATLADQHPYWIRRDSSADPQAARARAGTASLLAMDSAAAKELPNADVWVPLRTRVLALLDALERGGCFILRKGALESYAGFAGLGAKPEAAALAAEAILVADEASLRLQWGDIIRALEYSAQHPRVDEAGQLRKILLSALAPCLDGGTADTPSSELNQRARELLKDRAVIFDIENVTVGAGPARLKVTMTSRILDGRKFPIELTKDTLYAVLGEALPSGSGPRSGEPRPQHLP